LFAAENTKTPIQALLFERIELGAQKRKRIDMHWITQYMAGIRLLPDPLAISE
jgi:hypothetical protein